MNPAIIIICLLLCTSAIMTVAMMVAWIHFGRQRHVLSWALCYAASTLQWTSNAGGFLLRNNLLMALTAICVVFSGTLIFVGVCQRSKRKVPWRILIVTGSTVAIGGVYAAIIHDRALQGMIAPGYVAFMIACSAVALWPRGRRFSAPELGFFVMLALFALFQTGLAGSAAMNVRASAGDDMALYRVILALALPSIYVGTGVAAVLLVAGDLAHQLRRQMRHDPLTNVLNRRGLDEAAERAIATARRYERSLTLVICDLDGFKALNDGHGHMAGDTALCAFAQLLSNAVRRGDVVARMGGDEFGLLLMETSAQAAADVMERVRVEVSCLVLPSAPFAHLRASFGVADLQDGDSHLDDMVARADSALYASKREGKDRVSVWRKAA